MLGTQLVVLPRQLSEIAFELGDLRFKFLKLLFFPLSERLLCSFILNPAPLIKINRLYAAWVLMYA